MKKLVIAAALLVFSASARAATYTYEGMTVHIQDGCRSSCLLVVDPGHVSHHGNQQAKARKLHKDIARIASARTDNAVEAAPSKIQDRLPQAAPTDAAPAN
jgi:hypothetical protein